MTQDEKWLANWKEEKRERIAGQEMKRDIPRR